MPGPPPQPTRIKSLRGNPGKRALNAGEPEPRRGVPSCPSHLDPAAKKEWRRVARLLEEVGLLTLVDRAALALYCAAWARWVDAEEKLAASGPVLKSATGRYYPNPLVAISRQAARDIRAWAMEFGLTPSARSRMRAVLPDDAAAAVGVEASLLPYREPEGGVG